MSGETVLIVDDEPGSLETLGDILELHGYAVLTAQTGADAESLSEAQEVAAALLDLRLPDRSGIDVLRFIKEHAPETEVLMISGHAALASAIEAMQYGAFGYVQKPVNVDEVLSGLKRALERRRMVRELRQANAENLERLQELELLLETNRVVASHLELAEVLQILAEQMVRRLQVTLCHIATIDDRSSTLTVCATYPIRELSWRVQVGSRISLDQSPTYRCVVEGKELKPIRRNDDSQVVSGDEMEFLLPDGAQSAFLVPMVVRERVVGVVTLLEVREWSRSGFSPRKVSLCRAMASGAAVAIENALLFRQRELAHLETLAALASALDARERETRAHSHRVQNYTLRLAKELGIPGNDWKHLAAGALLHDIGKIGVPDAILLKDSRLTDIEWQQMRLHPLIGDELLKGVGHLVVERDVVLAHHEHWNGAGYPRGLAGDKIPLSARIFSVVDALDAITSDRPYRKMRSFEEARAEIARCTGTQFDPEVAAAFLRVPLQAWEEIQREAQAEREVFLWQDSASYAMADQPARVAEPENRPVPYALGAPRAGVPAA